MKKIVQFIWHIPRNLLIFAIRTYQFILSPDHSFWAKHIYPNGYCRFYPSCSSYTTTSIQKYGVVAGGLKGAWRIVRCNPWNKGGEDLP